MIRFDELTHVGYVRSNNEDRATHLLKEKFQLFLVCDGMGGVAGGEIAAQICCDSLHTYYSQFDMILNPEKTFIEFFELVQNDILNAAKDNFSLKGMGTTAVLLLITEKMFHYAHIGDSRLYHARGGKVTQLTDDHTIVQDMINRREISKDKATYHPYRNILTRVLGSGEATPEIVTGLTLKRKDKFLLATDGLLPEVDAVYLEEILAETPYSKVCQTICQAALEAGGSDNITMILVDVIG